MRTAFGPVILVLLVVPGSLYASGRPAFSFGGIEYFHRWSKADQHEFTPNAQTDLRRWTDMMSVVVYRHATDGDGLAIAANNTLETYKKDGAQIFKTSSVPRTANSDAEHLMVVVLGRASFLEAVFARLKLVDGVGHAFVYSHRVYGDDLDTRMSAWLRSNGERTEAALLKWTEFPHPAKPSQAGSHNEAPGVRGLSRPRSS